jgi:hypothetical protein
MFQPCRSFHCQRKRRRLRSVVSVEPVGGEFQPPLETGYPGGGAYHIMGSFFICVLNKKGTPRFDARVPFRIRKTLV